jgi:hypothetical protein
MNDLMMLRIINLHTYALKDGLYVQYALAFFFLFLSFFPVYSFLLFAGELYVIVVILHSVQCKSNG